MVEKNASPVAESLLRRMTDAVAHRGPDGEGIVCFGPVGLGHRRLAILDLSPKGAQPMGYGNSGLTITHNGEIYNYREIRAELIALGYAFTTETDTEVILAAYDAWGEDCVQHFNGMWAFAIHDAKRNTLFCSRDRFGVKPFYYHDTAVRFAFGSEIRQLLPFLSAARAHRATVENFLVTAASDLDAQTFFEGILRLLPGHNLTYDLTNHTHRIVPYYRLQRPDNARHVTRDQAGAHLYGLLSDAVALRLRSDVKVGTCLSGGLDSSSVATIAATLSSEGAFAAITAVSEQDTNNEVEYARQVVEHSALDWYQVKPSYEDFVTALPHVVHTQEEPFGSASIVMQYLVMQTARANRIPVLLDGQGGDELLLGYERYYATSILAMLRQQGFAGTLREIGLIRRNNSKMNFLTIAKYLLGSASSHLRCGFYAHRHRYIKNRPARAAHLKALARVVTDVWALQALDITTTNLPVLLRFEDKNSMAHAVETRLPFLDYRLVEAALALPVDYKIHRGWSKWLLRSIMDGKMPDSIVWRKNKFGFEAPEDIWFKRHADTMRDTVFASPLLRNISDPARLQRLYGTLDARSKFRLYSVALWESAFGVVL